MLPLVLNFHRRGRLRMEWEEGVDRQILDPELVSYIDEAFRKLDEH